MKNTDPKLDSNEVPNERNDNSSENNSGLFSEMDSTPPNDQVEGTGIKGGGPLKKRTKHLGASDVGSQMSDPTSMDSNNNPLDGSEDSSQYITQDQTQPRSDFAPIPEERMEFGTEDAPTAESDDTESGIGDLLHKVTTTLGISRSSKEDSPDQGESQTKPAQLGKLKPRIGPFEQETEKTEIPVDDSENGTSLGRLEELSSSEDDELKTKKPTTGPLGKRQTGPIYRKRQTGPLVLPNMELDPNKPAEEESWIKSVTGTLLGHEEPEAVPPDETHKVTSRLESLDQELKEEQAGIPQKAAAPPPLSEDVLLPAQKSPFVQDQPQPSPEGDAEFQAFLDKLKQLDQEKEPGEIADEAKTKKLTALPEHKINKRSSKEEKSSGESVFKLSKTKRLGQEEPEEIIVPSQSPFVTEIESEEEKIEPFSPGDQVNEIELTDSAALGGIDASTWELPPEVQDLIEKQREGAQAGSLPVEKPEQKSVPESSVIPDLKPESSAAFDEQLFPWNLEDNQVTQPSNEPQKTQEKPSSDYEFGPLDFLSSEETAASEPETGFDSVGTFDFLNSSEESPQTETSQESYDFGAFDFLKTADEGIKAAEEENKPLIGGIEPPAPDYFYKEPETASTGDQLTRPRRPIREPFPSEDKISPFTGISETSGEPTIPIENDLRSLFETEDSFPTQETVFIPETAPVPASLEESTPKPPEATPITKMSSRTKLLVALGALAISFTLFVILMVVVVIRSNLIPLPIVNQPKPTVSAVLVPIPPTGLELTGGWTFYLKQADLQNGVWVPQGGPEWLNGTELRRVVALPWNPQLDAVVQTLKDGDPVRLLMSNNDIIMYRVDKVEKVEQENVEILGGNTPGLVVVLYRQDSRERWVVICRQ